MIIDAKTTDEKLQCEINRKAAKMQHYNLTKKINMNILQVKEYCLLIKVQ